MNRNDIENLLKRYSENKCSAREIQLLEEWADIRSRKTYWEWTDGEQRMTTGSRIKKQLKQMGYGGSGEKTKRIYRLKTISIAASILLVVSMLYYGYGTFIVDSDKTKLLQTGTLREAVLPGTKTATLTLSNGSRIKLAETTTGEIAQESGIRISKNEDGEIVYDTRGVSPVKNKNQANVYNIVSTPRGGQYKVILPDGTKVWLNAASSLRYPACFDITERRVQLLGEAYFEVNGQHSGESQEKVPFIVSSEQQETLVTGTHFNINAYPDESRIVTTLLEGSVEVKKGGQQMALAPGQQVVNFKQHKLLKKNDIDASLAISWKNGYFTFEDQNIQTIMKNISRWYDVDIIFQGDSPKRKIGGTFSRSKSLDDLLKYLEDLAKVRFKKEGRRVIVMT
ncbi:DUF4974 domain-containing protein [Olivibacter sp. SDN3]|uniref:FecR family protein n=1 Tax=Olivibacter sp. SDN3 TaxID=2764720 RepID=UPI0016510D7E|nr:FecR domain-containing protein [Olivibacter sp. SDN3]QNL51751.1 DUF4974 domain-containing protein [Olivibacter sp. SDN3]